MPITPMEINLESAAMASHWMGESALSSHPITIPPVRVKTTHTLPCLHFESCFAVRQIGRFQLSNYHYYHYTNHFFDNRDYHHYHKSLNTYIHIHISHFEVGFEVALKSAGFLYAHGLAYLSPRYRRSCSAR